LWGWRVRFLGLEVHALRGWLGVAQNITNRDV
jgi:hypothetical protein